MIMTNHTAYTGQSESVSGGFTHSGEPNIQVVSIVPMQNGEAWSSEIGAHIG